MRFELNYGGQREKINLYSLYLSTLSNFLAAAAVAFTFSVPIEKISECSTQLKPAARRGTVFLLKKGNTLIDDTYNSNPAALESALKNLTEFPSKRKIAVLGDMLELGEDSVKYHVSAGKQVVENGFDLLVTVGPLAKHIAEGARERGMVEDSIQIFKDSQEAAKKLGALLGHRDLILVKGSRGMRMEHIIEQLKEVG